MKAFPEVLYAVVDGDGNDEFINTYEDLESLEEDGLKVAVYRLEYVSTLSVTRHLPPAATKRSPRRA